MFLRSLLRLSRHILAVIVIAAMTAFIMLNFYSDMLYTAQDRSMFFSGSMFFKESMAVPFGLMQYVGSYLTQFLYYPALGVTMLIAVWSCIYLVGVKAFRFRERWAPLAILLPMCLLTSIVDVGYWIYIMPMPGYWFSQSVAYLAMLLLLLAWRKTPSRFRAAWYLVAFLLYPLMGWMAMFLAVTIFVAGIAEGKRGMKDVSIGIIALALVFVAPLTIWKALLYGSIPSQVIMLSGFPFFDSNTVSAWRPSIPFFILMALTLLFVAMAERLPDDETKTPLLKKLRVNGVTVTILVSVVSYLGVWQMMFKDYNYLSEMRMNILAMNDDWQGVLQEAQHAKYPSRTMVVLKNIALMNTGETGKYSFIMGNSGEDINNPDSLNLSIMQIAAPMVYYNYGKVNFAIRWCMENAVSYGFSPYYLKMLARSAKAKGEQAVLDRYMNLLSHTLFHSDWKPQPTSAMVAKLDKAFVNVIDSDDNDLEKFLLNVFSRSYISSDPVVKEQSLLYAMLNRDPNLFWPAFVSYVGQNPDAVPASAYQEAFCLFMDKYRTELPFEVKVESEVVQNYKAFQQAIQQCGTITHNQDEIGEMLRDKWSDTYWWYNYFGRDKY